MRNKKNINGKKAVIAILVFTIAVFAIYGLGNRIGEFLFFI